ncbi:MAG: hypothetical protein H0X40_07355 [Chthoniobacterales bacterium]|nr:hypothetical protein [Chthoniobacterales bacterium]
MSEKKISTDLEIYLRDHYAGGVGAVELIEHLAAMHAEDSLGPFFRELAGEVKSDHETLHDLMTALGGEVGSVRNAGAWVAEKFGRAKLGFSTGDDADLGLLQSLEVLYAGITGKRLLWRALAAVKTTSPILEQIDFDRLERRALEQAEKVESKRLDSARETLRAD